MVRPSRPPCGKSCRGRRTSYGVPKPLGPFQDPLCRSRLMIGKSELLSQDNQLQHYANRRQARLKTMARLNKPLAVECSQIEILSSSKTLAALRISLLTGFWQPSVHFAQYMQHAHHIRHA